MGQGYDANFAMVVEEDKLKQFPSYLELLKVLDNYDISMEAFGQAVRYESDVLDELSEEAYQKIEIAYQTLKEDFKGKYGLDIAITYHSSEDKGDRYDEVNGHYFILDFDDIYQLSPEAEKAKSDLDFEMKFFVTYG